MHVVAPGDNVVVLFPQRLHSVWLNVGLKKSGAHSAQRSAAGSETARPGEHSMQATELVRSVYDPG